MGKHYTSEEKDRALRLVREELQEYGSVVKACSAAEVAAGDRYGDRVRSDCAEATTIGITAVPAFILDRSFLVSGAQPPELLGRALGQAAAATA